MKRKSGRQYFIVKHGLDAFQAMPIYIWNTAESKDQCPRGYRQIKKGDQWLGFAYTSSDKRERKLSLVTGFYECTREARYDKLPPKGLAITPRKKHAWLIQGKPYGIQLEQPIGIPSIEVFLDKKTWRQSTLTKVTAKEFRRIRDYVKRHKFNPRKIPLLGREPRCEQEVVAIVAHAHEKFGIEKIIRARTQFPDFLVKLKGKKDTVHLELELYSRSFLSHGHHGQMPKGKRGLFPENPVRGSDMKPVAVLCWIDDDKDNQVRKYVHQVFELQSLIRENKKIRW